MKARTVDVTLGGEKRTLRYDLGAMEDYEKATTFVLEDGTVVRGSIFQGGGMPRSAHEFVALIWACLKAGAEAAGKPAPTRRDVQVWLSQEDALERMVREALELVSQNSPEARKGEKGSDGPPDPPTGASGSDTPMRSESSSSGLEKMRSGD